ncbi:redox-regulated ATPase YchF [Gammaproteobacteria bacterium]|nr:redox-regulated ATPase YchF [Gammaproteobacteria bacterium]
MSLKCGLVGLPNVGKSTFFNALTESGVEAQNYPFCTIDPNLGMVAVPDSRLNVLKNFVKPQRVIPAQMSFLDIAGLVAGASVGEGLGNKFLGHIREVQAILHVVRCFDDENVTHVDGSVDPVRDIQTIEMELRLADMQCVEKAIEKVKKLAKSGNKAEVENKAQLEAILALLSDESPLISWPDTLSATATDLQLLSVKPVLYVGNMADPLDTNNPHVEKLRAFAKDQGRPCLEVCAKIESELVGLDSDEKKELLDELEMQEPGLYQVIRASYDLLGLQTYFTAGVQEVRAWTIKAGYSAPMAAGVIHTDFEKHFIRAEIIAFKDYEAAGGESGAKEKGTWRLEGKDYIVQDGDVIYFRTTA